MFSKLRANYKLSNVLIRIAFVLTYVLYSWQNTLTTTRMMITMYGAMLYMPDAYIFVIAIFASLLIGVALMFLVPFVASFFLNFSHF